MNDQRSAHINPSRPNPTKWVDINPIKHTQTITWLLPTNCLSVFDHFVGLTLKGLRPAHLFAMQIIFIYADQIYLLFVVLSF